MMCLLCQMAILPGSLNPLEPQLAQLQIPLESFIRRSLVSLWPSFSFTCMWNIFLPLFLSQLSPWYWGPYIKDFVWKKLIYLWARFSVVWVTKAKYQIKLKTIKTLILAYKPVHFVLLTDSVITLSAKLWNPWPWMQTQQLSVGLITGFFEKQTSLPGSNKLSCSPFSSNFWVRWLTLLAYTFKWNSLTEIFGNTVFFVFWGLLLVSFQSIFSLLCPPPNPPPPKKKQTNKKKKTWNIKFFLFSVQKKWHL